MKIFGGILPSGSEMDRFVNEHPIVSIAGAIALYSAGNTLFKALTAPEGESPYALGYGAQGHLTKSQSEELKQIQKELKAASKMHSGQADRLKQLGGFGASTSTTTSSSSSHAMMPKEAAPTLLETQGASSGMFGRMRATPPSLRRRIAQSVGLGSAPTLFSGKQEISAKREEINLSGSVANLYAMDGFVPETADDMMVI
jgi:hypothetical protein